MRILAVKIEDHPGLGNLEVDFKSANGHAARLVVVAGENGCGKTAVLDAIFAAIAPTALLSSSRKLATGNYRILIETDTLNESNAFRTPIAPELFSEL